MSQISSFGSVLLCFGIRRRIDRVLDTIPNYYFTAAQLGHDASTPKIDFDIFKNWLIRSPESLVRQRECGRSARRSDGEKLRKKRKLNVYVRSKC